MGVIKAHTLRAFRIHVCAFCICFQGCDPSSSHSAASAWSDLAVWGAGPSVRSNCLCLHRSQCHPGKLTNSHHSHRMAALAAATAAVAAVVRCICFK